MISYGELGQVFDMDNPLTLEYFELVDNSSTEVTYCETHHILPESIFPHHRNSKWNKVRLTYEDHYKAHELLAQICIRYHNRRKMLRAWNLMCHTGDVIVDARTYAKLKIELRDALSKLTGKNNPHFGKKHSEATKREHSERMLGRKLSQDHVQKLRKLALIRRIPKDTFVDYLNKNTNLTMIGEYIDTNTPVVLQCCNNHEVFNRRPIDVKRGKVCVRCIKSELILKYKDKFETFLLQHTNLKMVGKYVDTQTATQFNCDRAHPEFTQIPSLVSQGYVCPLCRKEDGITMKQMRIYFRKLTKDCNA